MTPVVFNPSLHCLSLLFQGNVVCQNCILTELDLSAFLDGNGQLSVEATVCTRELFMKKVACQQALRGDLAMAYICGQK